MDQAKLPNGLHSLVEKVKACSLKFGIWMEPEMISPDSELYRAHPDWALHLNGREGTQGREQFVLDLSRKEVVDGIYEQISAVIRSADISYVKWVMTVS